MHHLDLRSSIELLRKVSLYLIGTWGHSCLLLAVDTAD